MIEISPEEYLDVRSEPPHFVVLEGHIIPAFEFVVRATASWVVVEKKTAIAEHLTAPAG